MQGSMEHPLRTTDSLRADIDFNLLKTDAAHVTQMETQLSNYSTRHSSTNLFWSYRR